MGQTFWIWTWAILVLLALIVFGFIFKSLFNSLLSAAHQLERVTQKLDELAKLLDEKPKVENPESSLLKDPGIALARRRELLKAKIKKQEQRQRRLIASLKRFDPNESRFH
jgi:flagellar biosynthesis/type III secretory pathway M-ring protein FliF/YscJ